MQQAHAAATTDAPRVEPRSLIDHELSRQQLGRIKFLFDREREGRLETTDVLTFFGRAASGLDSHESRLTDEVLFRLLGAPMGIRVSVAAETRDVLAGNVHRIAQALSSRIGPDGFYPNPFSKNDNDITIQGRDLRARINGRLMQRGFIDAAMCFL